MYQIYIGICYGILGVGKTLSSRYYSNWDYIETQLDYKYKKEIGLDTDERILKARTIYYTAPAKCATKMTVEISIIGGRMGMAKAVYMVNNGGEEEYSTDTFEDINLIIVDEIKMIKNTEF